jgi:hypothetical protein
LPVIPLGSASTPILNRRSIRQADSGCRFWSNRTPQSLSPIPVPCRRRTKTHSEANAQHNYAANGYPGPPRATRWLPAIKAAKGRGRRGGADQAGQTRRGRPGGADQAGQTRRGDTKMAQSLPLRTAPTIVYLMPSKRDFVLPQTPLREQSDVGSNDASSTLCKSFHPNL